ncbi:MAG TPA: hypothetical protein VMM55_04230 [Thermohalobaculum sp.]|nr:hypothetical protein [Thermohalobaculum sp.]
MPSRLAFSGIGHVVNRVHRVESATKRLGRPVLATRDFAAVAPGAWQAAGHVEGSEFAEPVEVFALDGIDELRIPGGAGEPAAGSCHRHEGAAARRHRPI